MYKQIIILSALVAATAAEAPLRAASYPPSGWKPQGRPFDLPQSYLPPAEQQQETTPNEIELEITKERVDYAGQLQGNSLTNQPNNAYLPPLIPEDVDDTIAVQDEILRVQGLPTRNSAQFKIVSSQQLNTQEFYPRQQFRQFRKPQPQGFTQQIRQQQFNQQPQFARQPSQAVIPLSQQYSAPDSKLQSSSIFRNSQSGERRTAIEALNAAVDAYNAAQDEISEDDDDDKNKTNNDAGYEYPIRVGKTSKGQYYVLGPDNTLQRVTFTTSQNKDEARNNGFTAQLKYTPVGEISDPVFKYNDKGQLVRIFRK